MGLDMTLYKTDKDLYITEEQLLVQIAASNDWNPQQPDDQPTLHLNEVMYWRKANAIHKWIVDNCQGGVDKCQLAYISHEQLHQLFNLCVKVLLNKGSANKLLPTESGFFFGPTDYDEYYYEMIDDTAEELQKIINSPFFETSFFVYASSW